VIGRISPVWSMVNRLFVDNEPTVLAGGFYTVCPYLTTALSAGGSSVTRYILIERLSVDFSRSHPKHVTCFLYTPHPSGGEKFSGGRFLPCSESLASYRGLRGRHRYRTTVTGADDRLATDSATLPRRILDIPDRPWLPMITWSTSLSST